MSQLSHKWQWSYVLSMVSLTVIDLLFIVLYAVIAGRYDVLPTAFGLSILFLTVINGAIAFFVARPLRIAKEKEAINQGAIVACLRHLPTRSAISVFFLSLVYTFSVFSYGKYVTIPLDQLGITQEKAIIAIVWFGGIYALQFSLYAYFVALDYVGRVRQDYFVRFGLSMEPAGMSLVGRLLVAMVLIAVIPASVVLADVHYFMDIRKAQELSLDQAILLDVMATLVAALFCLIVISRSISKPLGLLLDSVEQLVYAPKDAKVAVVSDDELGQLSARFNHLAKALSEKENIRATLYQFVNRDIAESYMAHHHDQPVGRGELKTATLMFTDVSGFSRWSESISPEQLVLALNGYYQVVSEVIKSHNGTVLNYIGDSVFAIFNIPTADEDHALNAVNCALEIQEKIDGAFFAGKSELPTRIGINTGPVVAGFVGTADHIEYSVFGDSVNIAARLEQLNKELGSSILMSHATARLIMDHEKFSKRLKDHDEIHLKGKSGTVKVFEI